MALVESMASPWLGLLAQVMLRLLVGCLLGSPGHRPVAWYLDVLGLRQPRLKDRLGVKRSLLEDYQARC